jgi:predicted  nucleic acid-binding Zn-ribbon protein
MTPSPSQDVDLPPRLAAALSRLRAALERLETAAARRIEADRSRADLEEELAIMQDDRSRLAQELDAALTRTAAVEKTRDEVLRRVARASAGVAAVLGLPQADDSEV